MHQDTAAQPWHRGVLAYWWLALLVLLVALSFGFVFFSRPTEQPVVSWPESRQENTSPSTQNMSVTQLLQDYLEAMGGREALAQIRSVRFEGRLVDASNQFNFIGLLLSPDKGMLVLESAAMGTSKFMLNGDKSWQVLERRDGTRQIVPLDVESSDSLKWSLRVHHTLRALALAGRYSDLTLREIEYLGKPCYELSKTKKDEFLAVLDKDSLFLLKTEEKLQIGGKASMFTVLYEDHREVSGIVEAHKTKLYKDGSLVNVAEIASYRINPGMVSSIFEIPEELGE